MSFTLRINFSGLCLFVPQPGDGVMHVLMPKTAGGHGGHGGHGGSAVHERHVAVLGFDTAHLLPNSAGPDGLTVQIKIRGNAIAFPGDGADPRVCPEVVNLGPLVSGPLDPDLFGSDEREQLAARVTLGAGKMSAVARGACWTWRNEVRRIAHQLEWTIDDVQAESLAFESFPLAGQQALMLPELHPVVGPDGAPAIEVFLHHLPPSEMLPDPAPAEPPLPGTPAPHFGPYYVLAPANDAEVPRFVSLDACQGLQADCPEMRVQRGGATFNCVTGSVVL